MADALSQVSIDTVERSQVLVERNAVAFAAVVFAISFVGMLVMYVRQSTDLRDLAVKLITATNGVSLLMDRLERRAARRRKPVTNPRQKLPEAP